MSAIANLATAPSESHAAVIDLVSDFWSQVSVRFTGSSKCCPRAIRMSTRRCSSASPCRSERAPHTVGHGAVPVANVVRDAASFTPLFWWECTHSVRPVK
jgi:hypothetical protein